MGKLSLNLKAVFFYAVAIILVSVKPAAFAQVEDPLPSWNEGSNKESIVKFVRGVTTKGGSKFVSQANRIAVFDNDGTLWGEQPLYVQLMFLLDRVKSLAPRHPEWKDQQPFKAALEGDIKKVLSGGEQALLKLVMATHANTTTKEFSQIVTDWLAAASHPKTKRPYTDMVYQPMLELIDYLHINGFKTYIISGGGIEFMRPWTEKVYGIPPEQVIGSSIKTEFKILDGNPVLVRLPKLNFYNDKEGKPVAINQHIGRRPIAAFGNSDGDLQMLQWTEAGDGERLMLLVHHTDADREWAYDRESHIGRLDKAMDEAQTKGWVVVDMKKDWKVIYPFQVK
jgi:phosphoserine phosphatase